MHALRNRTRKNLLTAAFLLATAAGFAGAAQPWPLSPAVALAQDALTACADSQDVSPALLAQAQERLSGSSEAAPLSDSMYPNPTTLGLSTTGEARVAVIRVSFPASEDGSEPAYTIPASQSDDDLLQVFNGEQDSSSEYYPYESLHAYYERSSYGKLDIQAQVVVNYTAKYPRSHYESGKKSTELLAEALAGVDDEVDFSACDANNDGYVDAVYLQYAGPSGAWGSTWWPSMRTVADSDSLSQTTLDGKRIKQTVKMPSTEGGSYSTPDQQRITAIHETGHVLGLPDLYHYDEGSGDGSNGKPGVGTFDMMCDNTGDQNGFCKWMLGWMDPESITYVYTSEKGVDVRRGSGETVHYDDTATLDLTPYTSDITDQTGGFVAVSADESILEGDLFCKFYLLQFDHAAGNQTVRSNGALLGHGVRAFRVNAALTSDKGYFIRNNTNGRKYSQLFEVVDPTEGGAADELGSFLRAGTTVSPTSKPSSNFAASENLGYSGITFEVVSEKERSAQVKFWWTKQSEIKPLALAPVRGTTLSGMNTLQFNTSEAVRKNYSDSGAYVVVDGKKHDVATSFDETNQVFSITTLLDPQDLRGCSSAELVVEAGYFDLGNDADGSPRRSDEIRVPLQVADIPAIVSSGHYKDAATSSTASHVRSAVFRDRDGASCFIELANASSLTARKIYLITLSEDGTTSSSIEVEDGAVLWGQAGAAALRAFTLDDGTVFICSKPNGDLVGAEKGTCLEAWVDPRSGKVLARKLETAMAMDVDDWMSVGASAAYVASYGSTDGGPTLTLTQPEGSGTQGLDTKLVLPEGFGRVSGVFDASEDYVLVYSNDDNEHSKYVRFSKQDIAANAGGAVGNTGGIISVELDYALDAKVKDDVLYVACYHSDSKTGALVDQLKTYSLDGTLLSSTDVSPQARYKSRLCVSDSGSVAWMVNKQAPFAMELIKQTVGGQTLLIDPSKGEVHALSTRGEAAGTWIGNQWLYIYEDIDSEGLTSRLRWLLTAGIGEKGQDTTPDDGTVPDSGTVPGDGTKPNEEKTPDSGTKPGSGTTPDGGAAGDGGATGNVIAAANAMTSGADAKNEASLPSTGDAAGSSAPDLLALGMAMVAAAWAAARGLRA